MNFSEEIKNVSTFGLSHEDFKRNYGLQFAMGNLKDLAINVNEMKIFKDKEEIQDE